MTEKTIKELNKEIELLKAALARAEEEKDKYEAIISAIGDGIIIQDTDYKIIYQNQIQNEQYGDRKGEICYQTYEGKDRICEDCPVEKTFKDGKIHRSERKLPSSNGFSYYELTSSPLRNRNGRIVAGIKIVRDITERKRIEEKLLESEKFLESIFSSIQDGIGIIDTEMNIIGFNRTAEIWYPHSVPFIGKKCYEAYHNIKVPCDICPAQETLKTGKSAHNIIQKHGPKGEQLGWLEIYTFPLFDISSGHLKGVIEYVRDISERKRIVEELKQSEEKYRLLIENMQEGVFIIQDEKMHFANQAISDITGYSNKEIIGKNFSSFIAPEDIKMVYNRYIKKLRRETVSGEYEFHMLRKDGKKINVIMSVGLVTYRGRIANMGILRDVTEKKRAEESLKLLSETVESAPDSIIITDPDGNIIYSNKATEKIFGFSKSELEGKIVASLNLDLDIFETLIKPSILEKGGWTGELNVRHKDGHGFPVWLTTSLVEDEKGMPIAVVGISRDITAKKKVENALLESEIRYRTLFESAGDAILIIEAEGKKKGKIVAANKTAGKMHGYSIEELLTLNISNLDTQESARQINNTIDRILKGETIKKELDHRRKDGTVFPVEIYAGLLELSGHKYILAFDRDITERKRAQEALRFSNLVVENSPTVLFRWKAQSGWPVEFVSKNIVQFGYKAEEFLSGGLPYASIIHPDDLERISKEVERHSNKGKDKFQQEYRIITKNGSVRWVDDRTVVERDKNGQITHYQGIIIDITERKKAEKAIKKYNMELEESNLLKELFIDIMHHDLLNPLNIANGYVEIFLEEEKDVRKKSYLEAVRRNLMRGMMLIDNATKYSRLQSMKHVKFDELDLRILIKDTIENLTPLASSAGMAIENNIKHVMKASVNPIIEDVFSNIISNAIKYASAGKKVIVDGETSEKNWLIKIIDFGPGIKDTDKKQIFERFSRKEKRGVKGSGLGLAIAGKIMELHRGRLWVEDNPEGGAIFFIEIQKN